MSKFKKFGTVTIGGGSGGVTAPYEIQSLLILGGNEIDGIPCIKPIDNNNIPDGITVGTSGGMWTIDTELPSPDSGDILPDGIGRAYLFKFTSPISQSDGLQSPDGGTTGRVYVLNYSYFTSYPLVAGVQVPTYSIQKMTWTDPGDPENIKTYNLYIPHWR